uniref:Putative lambda recombination protein n=1 Tax=viral metagenome TaxID=1070528 RepID=A0A6M3JKI0_9ZZZZ
MKIDKPKKKVTLSGLKKKVWVAFSEWIRTRDCLRTTGCKDWGLCITCGKRYHIKLLQAGHFISGRHNANLFSEMGVHAQCYNCNINLRGNTLEYRRKIIELYDEGADLELEAEARQIKKFTIPELEALLIEYKNKIKELREVKYE